MSIQKTNNQISFQSVKCYEIPKKSFETFQRRVRKLTKCEAIVIKQSPAYDRIETATKIAGENLSWIQQHLELRGFNINLPTKAINSDKVKVYVIRGKDKIKYDTKTLFNNIKDMTINIRSNSYKKYTKDKDAKEFLSDYLYYDYFRNQFNSFLQTVKVM